MHVFFGTFMKKIVFFYLILPLRYMILLTYMSHFSFLCFLPDEYTKITTPRQDVLFKKGYLSQKKTQPSSSSVDSASAATTPSASTNGTPDTQSTNGINSGKEKKDWRGIFQGILYP